MNHILLTGVTGLVGRHILYQLLREGMQSGLAGQIFLTMRPTQQAADERLRQLFVPGACPGDLAMVPTETLLQRVRIIEVDLVDEALVDHIKAAVGREVYVIHCAASTNLAPSDVAREEVAADVLGATRNLLEAVRHCTSKFVYIGTAFATGSVGGTLEDDFSAFDSASARNHYERAKLEAERMLARFCDDHGMAWQILRPSVVCGRLLDAPLHYMSKFDVFYGYARFFSRLLAAGCQERVRLLCHERSSINIVPVDYVARAIVRSYKTRLQQLNIVHTHNVSARQLVTAVLNAVGFHRFEFVDEMPDQLNETEQLYYSTAGAIFSSYLTSPAQRYDARRLGLLLDGLPPPDVTAQLPALLAYAVDCQFSSAQSAETATRRDRRFAPKRVVLVGSGYVACYAYQSLKRRLRAELASGAVEVTVVSASSYHVFHGFVGEVVAGVLPLETAFSPSRQLFDGARFVQGVVNGVDLDAGKIRYAAAGGESRELAFDELVLATGSENDTEGVPGLARFGQSVRSFASLQRLQQHVVQQLERAEGSRDVAQAQQALTFCVAGAGFTGVEMGSALAQFLNTCKTHYPVLNRVPARILLVHSGDEILPELQHHYGRLVAYVRRQIDQLGIELKLGARLRRVEAHRAELDDGSWITSGTVISTVGHRPALLPGTESCLLDTQRRLVGDSNLNLLGHDNVWIGGDCASIRQPLKVHSCPTNALWAIKHGQHIGRNIARRLRGRKVRSFKFVGLGQAASLGDRKGIAELYGLQMTGFLAKVIRLWFFLYYMPNKRNAVQVLFELTLRRTFGSKLMMARDIDTRWRQAQAMDDQAPVAQYPKRAAQGVAK